jgi:hypothetical protein
MLSDDGRGDQQPRVLLFMRPGRDRELLIETLEERYAAETTTEIDSLETEFDCCVFDTSGSQRVVGTVQSKRDISEPMFLPFVLLTEETVERRDVGAGSTSTTSSNCR